MLCGALLLTSRTFDQRAVIRLNIFTNSVHQKKNLFFELQKEDDGEILNSLTPPETTFEQSGLGPGQEYEVKLEVIKNNTRGPPASKNVVTSKQLLTAFNWQP